MERCSVKAQGQLYFRKLDKCRHRLHQNTLHVEVTVVTQFNEVGGPNKVTRIVTDAELTRGVA
jgi:hypothetical protein